MKNHFGIPFSDVVKNKNYLTLDEKLFNKIIYVKKFNPNSKVDNYIYIIYRDISKLEIGLTTGRMNDVSYEYYYFTFKMKTGEWIDIDICEAPKFMDLIKIAKLENSYNEAIKKTKSNNEEIEK